MKILILILLSLTAYGQTKIWVDPTSNLKAAIADYDDVPLIKMKPGESSFFVIGKDINLAPSFIFIDAPRDSTASYRVRMTVEKIEETLPVIEETIIDAAQAVFTGTWTKGPTDAQGWYGGTIAYSNSTGATVSLTFTGRKIEFYAETLPTHGTGTVKIDNEPEVTVSFKSTAKVLPAKIFEKSWATDGPHSIVVKVVSGYVLADYFKIYSVK